MIVQNCATLWQLYALGCLVIPKDLLVKICVEEFGLDYFIKSSIIGACNCLSNKPRRFFDYGSCRHHGFRHLFTPPARRDHHSPDTKTPRRHRMTLGEILSRLSCHSTRFLLAYLDEKEFCFPMGQVFSHRDIGNLSAD